MIAEVEGLLPDEKTSEAGVEQAGFAETKDVICLRCHAILWRADVELHFLKEHP